jgi:hypothetical protein
MIRPRARERAKLATSAQGAARPHCPGKVNVGRRHRGVRHSDVSPSCLVGCAQGSGACATGPGGARARLGPLRPARLSPWGIVPRLVHGAVFTTEGAARHLAAKTSGPLCAATGRLAGTIIPW